MGKQDSRGQDESNLAPPDLEAVLADDRVVEAVASGALTTANVSDEVHRLLVSWRDDIDAAPLPLHPDLDEAAAALLAAVRGARWRIPLRVFSPVAAAAAVVGIALVGIGYGAHQSTPGDPLWGVSQAIFSDHSRSVQAAANVTAELAAAETAIDSGAPEKARTALDRAAANLSAVGAGEDRQGLEQRRTALVARLSQTATTLATGTVTAPPAPSSTATTTTATPSPAQPSIDAAPSTGSAASTTRTVAPIAPTRTPGPATTTPAAPTTTPAAPTTTPAEPATTPAAPATTPAAPATTPAAPATTPAAPATTSLAPTTTAPAPSSAAPSSGSISGTSTPPSSA